METAINIFLEKNLPLACPYILKYVLGDQKV